MTKQRSRLWSLPGVRTWHGRRPSSRGRAPGPADAAVAAAGAASGAAQDAVVAAAVAATAAGDAQDAVINVAEQVASSARETEQLVEGESSGPSGNPVAPQPGTPFDRRSAFYMGFVATIGVLLAYGLVQLVLGLHEVITFVVIALFLSLGLEPIVAWLGRRGWRRGWAVLLVFAGLVVVAGIIGGVVVPPVVTQTTDLVERAPSYLADLQHNQVFMDLNARWHLGDKLGQDLQQRVLTQSTLTSVFGGILGAGKAIVGGAVGVFTVIVLTLYFLSAMPRVKTAAYQLVPRSRRPRFVYLSEEISRRVGGYVLGQLCVATINGVLSYVILEILGLPFAVVLAVLVGLFALVPIVGTLVAGVLVTGVALASSWQEALIVLVYYILYHLLEAYVLAPRIMRRAVHVPAVVTILAILAGGALLGVLGALIAIPVAAGLLLIYEEVLVPRQQSA